jgi:hypothetical protein
MALGWKVLLPLGLLNTAVTGSLVVFKLEALVPWVSIAAALLVLAAFGVSGRRAAPAPA